MFDLLDRYMIQDRHIPATSLEMAGAVGLAAELLKYHNERALLHRMLTSAGIPETTPNGEAICLIGRMGVAVVRLR
jgi:hypothetical protein